MVDFKKRLGHSSGIKVVDPREIYNTLDRLSEAGPLRDVQNRILAEWFENRKDEKNIIVKLHTGEGKTLIGLLMLLSRINQGKGPCLYVCPNKLLTSQVVTEAVKFGIPYCVINEFDNSIPRDFLECKKILIIHAQKVFNGLSIFGIGTKAIKAGTILLDDSHSCIDIIKDSFTIKISRYKENSENPLYSYFINRFEDDLKAQGQGDFLSIKEGRNDIVMQIPYWSWIDNTNAITNELNSYHDSSEIKYPWPLVRNRIEDCTAYITGELIEIVPNSISVEQFGTFSHADQRILMSATTQDDAFFIKGLGFEPEAISSPLEDSTRMYSGEKMVIIPSLISVNLNRDTVIQRLAKPKEGAQFGRVVIVPSYKHSDDYAVLGSTVAKRESINEVIDSLKNGEYINTVVFVNRYDGIDLPDQSCRVLVLDSMPFFISLCDKYEERCRVQSDVQNIKVAQKIEQGMGRSVRGEKDFSVIIVIGANLVQFIMSPITNKYFSNQTRKQINIGIEIAEMAKEDPRPDQDDYSIIDNLISQAIVERENWKEFYYDRMNNSPSSESKPDINQFLITEREAEKALSSRDYEKASALIQKLLDSKQDLDPSERGWYLQKKAHYMYHVSKVESAILQKAAFSLNNELLCPKDGLVYKKIGVVEGSRMAGIKTWISSKGDYNSLSLHVDAILNDLSFGVNYDLFEEALKNLGLLLGYGSQRPDKEYKKGADNLWHTPNGKFFMIESKNMVNSDRECIKKSEASQMNTHIEWFKSEYGEISNCKPIMVIPTRKLADDADINSDVTVLRKNGLDKLKKNVRSFIKELKDYNLSTIDDKVLQRIIDTHDLSEDALWNKYSESIEK